MQQLFCFMGPSGTGKDSILAKLSGIRRVARLTTRGLKPGEVEGIHYRIISREDYERLYEAGLLVFRHDHAGNLYGIEIKRVEDELAHAVSNEIPLIVTNIYEWIELRQRFLGRLKTVYVRPESVDEAERRLHERGDDSPEKIRERMDTVRKELAYVDALPDDVRKEIHFVINRNGELDAAVAEVQSLVSEASV